MDKTIKELEKELSIAKGKHLKAKWDVYFERIKKFVMGLEGKTLMSHYRNGSFILYKVLGYEEHSHVGPKKWIEIHTTGYIDCNVADNRGNWFRGHIEHQGSLQFKAKVYKNKTFPKILEMAKIEWNDHEVSDCCLVTTSETVKIGYDEAKQDTEDPSYDRALDRLLSFTQIAPEGMWEAAKAVADDNLLKTKAFWDEFEPKCKELKPIYTTNPL